MSVVICSDHGGFLWRHTSPLAVETSCAGYIACAWHRPSTILTWPSTQAPPVCDRHATHSRRNATNPRHVLVVAVQWQWQWVTPKCEIG